MEHAIHAENQAVSFTFRSTGDPSTATPSVRVLDNTGALAATLTPGSGLTQGVGADDTLFSGSFTPTDQGLWKLHATDAHGGDQVRDIAVGAHGLQWVVTKLVGMDIKLDTLDGKADSIQSQVDANAVAIGTVDGKLDVVDGKVDVALTNIATNLAAIMTMDGKVDTVLVNLSAMDTKLDSIQTGVNSIDPSGGAHFG